MLGKLKFRGLMAVALGLGVLGGFARAQHPTAQPSTGVIVVEEECADCQTPIVSSTGGVLKKVFKGEGKSHKKHEVQRQDEKEIVAIGNRRPAKPCVLCYSHINDYTCSSLKTETFFIFGSCRWFFGEKCLKGPPPAIPQLDKEPVTPMNPLRR